MAVNIYWFNEPGLWSVSTGALKYQWWQIFLVFLYRRSAWRSMWWLSPQFPEKTTHDKASIIQPFPPFFFFFINAVLWTLLPVDALPKKILHPIFLKTAEDRSSTLLYIWNLWLFFTYVLSQCISVVTHKCIQLQILVQTTTKQLIKRTHKLSIKASVIRRQIWLSKKIYCIHCRFVKTGAELTQLSESWNSFCQGIKLWLPNKQKKKSTGFKHKVHKNWIMTTQCVVLKFMYCYCIVLRSMGASDSVMNKSLNLEKSTVWTWNRHRSFFNRCAQCWCHKERFRKSFVPFTVSLHDSSSDTA